MNDDYTRTTRRTSTRDLAPALREAAVHAARGAGHEDLDAMATLVLETHSVKTRAAGFFARMLGGDADREHWSVLVVTPGLVLIGTHGVARGTWMRLLPTATLELQAMPSMAGDLGARTILLASPVLASPGPNGESVRVGAFPLVLATLADAGGARGALESVLGSPRG